MNALLYVNNHDQFAGSTYPIRLFLYIHTYNHTINKCKCLRSFASIHFSAAVSIPLVFASSLVLHISAYIFRVSFLLFIFIISFLLVERIFHSQIFAVAARTE